MYYILSSIRSDWPYGLSPGGLPGGEEYMGHTFWDQDIWMYPVLVLLYPDLARSCLQYRYERLPAARLQARTYGFEGMRIVVFTPLKMSNVDAHFNLSHEDSSSDIPTQFYRQ